MNPASGADPEGSAILPPPPAYSRRHQDAELARVYGRKFSKTLLRRLGNRRERRLVASALDRAWFERFGASPAAPPMSPPPTLLDLPCGAGRFADLLSALPVRYLAADYSAPMLDLCAEALSRAGRADRLAGRLRCDARTIPLPGSSIDLACCLRLLHHFPKPQDRAAILHSFRRVLRGPLVLGFLDADSPKQWMHRRKRALAGTAVRRSLLSKDALADEAAESGFRIVRCWSLSGWFSGQSLALLLPR